MVEVVYRGGIGDRLFQYCFARILAGRWGMKMKAPALPGFPCARGSEGRQFMAPFRCWSGLAVEDRQTSALIRGGDLERPLQGRLMIYGWFHRWELYREAMGEVRGWVQCAAPASPAGEGDLVVVMRFMAPEAWQEPSIHSGQAPSWSRAQPSVESIQRLADRLRPERLIIVADLPQRVDRAAFAPHLTEVRGLGGFEMWNWLRSARRIAIPLGHASDWWAAQLSGAREIYVCDPWTEPKAECAEEYG